LWQVPDAQTAELMAQLYLNWSKGMPFETAFFMAQKALKAKYEPYYWAAFQLVK
jgi:CHAT domain-containing protein